MSGGTTAAAETPQHLVFEPGMIVTAYVCVCFMHIHTKTHSQSPPVTIYTHTISTYCTLAISSKEPSLINMQSIIHTFVLSFLWQAQTGC